MKNIRARSEYHLLIAMNSDWSAGVVAARVVESWTARVCRRAGLR
jgi:hypothetical protein